MIPFPRREHWLVLMKSIHLAWCRSHDFIVKPVLARAQRLCQYITQFLEKTPLTSRERWLGLGGGCILLGGALYGFLLKPISVRTQRLYEIIPQKRQDLQKMKLQGEQYLNLQTRLKQLNEKLPETDAEIAPLPLLESLLENHDLKKQLTLMNQEPSVQEGPYTITVIQIRLEDVPLPVLLQLLEDIKDGEAPLNVETIQFSRRADSKGKLDAALTLNSVVISS